MKVVSAVNVPLDLVAVTLWGIRLEAMTLADLGAPSIDLLLMLLVVAMILIEKILEFAHSVFHVNCTNLVILDFGSTTPAHHRSAYLEVMKLFLQSFGGVLGQLVLLLLLLAAHM